MRETTRIWSLVCLTPKLQPSWPNANLFSCLSTSVSKAPMLHNNLLYLGLLLIFPPCCFHLSWVLHLEQPEISPWFCLARKESSFVGGWSLTRRISGREVAFHSGSKGDLLHFCRVNEFMSQTANTQSGKIYGHFSSEAGFPQHHNLSISEAG